MAIPPWGPGGTDPGPVYSSPIQIIDSVRSTLTGKKRDKWDAEVRQGLDQWGLPYRLTRKPESAQPFTATDENISTLGISPLATPGAITLIRGRLAVATDAAGWLPDVQGGAALISPWRGFWSGPGQIAGVVSHEVGHTLGFGHGGNGTMMGALRVNDEERAIAQSYYGGAQASAAGAQVKKLGAKVESRSGRRPPKFVFGRPNPNYQENGGAPPVRPEAIKRLEAKLLKRKRPVLKAKVRT